MKYVWYVGVQARLSYKKKWKNWFFGSSTPNHAESFRKYVKKSCLTRNIRIWSKSRKLDMSSGCPERQILVSRPGFFVFQQLCLSFFISKFIFVTMHHFIKSIHDYSFNCKNLLNNFMLLNKTICFINRKEHTFERIDLKHPSEHIWKICRK